MSWLVTGGAGYIGAHVLDEMISRGHDVIVLDNLSNGKSERLPEGVRLIIGDIFDKESLFKILSTTRIQGVINLAGLKSVVDSYERPEKYHEVNYQGVKNLIEGCKKFEIQYFLQSSTAAVYGQTNDFVVHEDSPTNPISPYGESKLFAEQEVSNFSSSGFGQGASLRYFNVIGSKSRKLRDNSTSNLLPIVLKSVKEGKRPVIYGRDYPTKDGTCIRDYIHVEDVAIAHVKAIDALMSSRIPNIINIGSGLGYSVLEMVNEILRVTNSNLEPVFTGRRNGDIASLIASTSLAKLHLNFSASQSLQNMIASSIK